jgi:hypothetical protein
VALAQVIWMTLRVWVVIDVADLLGVVQLDPTLLHIVHDHFLHVVLLII